LKEAGYFPAKVSDHDDFTAADLFPVDLPVERYGEILPVMERNPYLRQVIVAFKHDAKGKLALWYVHVSVVTPDKPALPVDVRAYYTVDGKRVKSSPTGTTVIPVA
jgi:hypothetical protein